VSGVAGKGREVAPPYVFWDGGMKVPPYLFLGGPHPKEEGRTECARSLAAARLAWMHLCCLFIYVSERRGREKGEGDGSAI